MHKDTSGIPFWECPSAESQVRDNGRKKEKKQKDVAESDDLGESMMTCVWPHHSEEVVGGLA